MKHKLAFAALTLFTLFFAYWSLVTLHANTPHSCPKHTKSLGCTHVSDAADTHAPGEQSENMKKQHKSKADWMDYVGCGCFWDCLFQTSTSFVTPKAPGIILKHGLFNKG